VDLARRVGAVHLRHTQVHENDVGPEVARDLERFDAVGGCSDDLDVVGEPDEHRQPFAYSALVVGDHDTDHAGTSSSTRHPLSVGPACIRPPARSSRSRSPLSPFPPPTPASPAESSGCSARRSSTVSEVELPP
jgi:hypothetical protein